MKVIPCPKCGHYNPIDQKTCVKCGADLPELPPPAPPVKPAGIDDEYAYKRPALVTVLVIFNVLVACNALVQPLFTPLFNPDASPQSPTLVIGFFVLAALALAASVGLYYGKPWGWWVGAFYYGFSFVRGLLEACAISAVGLSDVMAFLAYILDIVGRLLLTGAAFIYLFTEDPRGFMRVLDQPRGRALLLLAAAVAATLLALYFSATLTPSS